MTETGALVLVVGPSGAGKDTLIAAARRRLTPNPGVVFVRRYITRHSDAGGEPHITVSVREFAALASDGGFALQWQAHGLHYGIPISILQDLLSGRTVVANVSRTVIPAARSRFNRLAIAHVTADPGVLAVRLAQRGRESQSQIQGRLEREGIPELKGRDVVTIENGGALDVAVEQFVRLVSAEI